MNARRFPMVLAVLVSSATFARGAEPAVNDAAQYLQQNGLMAAHATYVKFFTLLAERKSVEANQVLADSLPIGVNPAVRDQVLRATAALSTVFDRGVESAELVGALRVSGNSIALYYVMNTGGGPVLVTLMPFRQRGTWRTHTWIMESNATKIIESLKGVTRFSESMVIPFTTRDKTA
jgi:hypothetical protein